MDRVGQFFRIVRTLLLASLAGGVAAGPARAQSEGEEADWLATQADGSQRAYELYLQRHPLSAHAGEAFAVISRMTVDPTWAPIPFGGGPGEPRGLGVPASTDVY
jgi:hypothetical protein